MTDRPDIDRVRDAMRAHDEAPRDDDAARRLRGRRQLRQRSTSTATSASSRSGASSACHAFGLNLIRLQPRQRGRIHRHERQEEVYLVLEGTLTLEVEGEAHELPRGSIARVAPAVRRRLVNAAREPLAVLAIGGAKPHEGRDGEAFAAWEDQTGAPPQEVPLPPDLEG